MTTATRIERSGPAIRAALAEGSPDECAEFEAEFRAALTQAETSFDLAPVGGVLDRWWGAAAIAANPLTEQEREQIERLRAGDESGWLVHNEDGTWTRL